MDDPRRLRDVVAITMKFRNGSVGTICYYSNGDKAMPKERVEIFSSGLSMVLDDFRRLTIYGSGKKKTKKLLSQDKGQKEEVKRFLKSVQDGEPNPIPWSEIYSTSLTTFKILESIRTLQAQTI